MWENGETKKKRKEKILMKTEGKSEIGVSVGVELESPPSTMGGAGVIYAQAGCDLCPLHEWNKGVEQVEMQAFAEQKAEEIRNQEAEPPSQAYPGGPPISALADEEALKTNGNSMGQNTGASETGPAMYGVEKATGINRMVHSKWFQVLCCMNLNLNQQRADEGKEQTANDLQADRDANPQLKETSKGLNRFLNANAYFLLAVLVGLYFYMK